MSFLKQEIIILTFLRFVIALFAKGFNISGISPTLIQALFSEHEPNNTDVSGVLICLNIFV